MEGILDACQTVVPVLIALVGNSPPTTGVSGLGEEAPMAILGMGETELPKFLDMSSRPTRLDLSSLLHSLACDFGTDRYLLSIRSTRVMGFILTSTDALIATDLDGSIRMTESSGLSV